MSVFDNKKLGLGYVSLYIVGFFMFVAYPFVASFALSFTSYDGNNSPLFIGIDNYIEMFSFDDIFIQSIFVTISYVILTVPFKLMFALFIAFILNFKLRGISFFRAAYYIPSLLGGSVAVAMLWKSMFASDGIISNIINFFIGTGEINFLGNEILALFVISFLSIWQFGSSMVIFLAGLQTVPKDYYDAASIDGASKWHMFYKITIPLISPVIFFNLVMQTAAAFQEFNAPYLITGGGPMGATHLLSMYIYNTAFASYRFGYAASLAWIMFFLIAGITLLYFALGRRLVYYQN